MSDPTCLVAEARNHYRSFWATPDARLVSDLADALETAVRLLGKVHLPKNEGCSGVDCAVCEIRAFLASPETT
jgi:hypothetical protein